jgi:nucleotide-binding universal stress UspA family protein
MSASENQGRGCVVVGLDEHGHPAGSLMAAADEAERRGTELAIVTVVRPKLDPGLNTFGLQREDRLAQATALQGLHAAAVSVQASHPGVVVSTYCLGEGEIGPNREPLLWAELLVVGTQDRYGRQALCLGSVSWMLLNSSRCPVLVVPDHPARRQARTDHLPLIAVGVSEHPADAAVVRAAYEAASGRACEVVLLHSYSLRADETPEQGRERVRNLLDGYVAQAPDGVRVSEALSQEEPAAALLRLTADATLLVIGGRTGALSGLVRGSVSHALLEAVPCPVLAVPRHLVQTRPGPLTGLTVDETVVPEPAAAGPGS